MKFFVGNLGKLLAKLIFVFPRFMQFWIGDVIGILWFDVFRIRRKIVLDNLNIAFPHMSEREKIKLGRTSCQNMCRGLVDYCYFHVVHKEKYKKHFVIEGRENYDEALKKGKGICALSMHLGNGDNAAAGLAIHGINVTIISKEFSIKWLNDLWFGVRAKIGVGFIPPRNSAFAILKALKKNKTVVFVSDQFMGPPIGVKTKFFGKETGTAMGLAVMAQRSGAPVITIHTYRRKDGVAVICLGKEIPFEEKESKDETIAHMTQVYTNWIEDRIREHPDQWMWVHRRWKEFS